MIIDITSKTVAITPSMRTAIEARLSKLEKNQIPLISPKVIIIEGKNSMKIEALINLPHGQLFASDEHEDLYVAINNMGHKLERQLHKFQSKPLAKRPSRSGKQQIRNHELPEQEAETHVA
ncbi:MULTISPECIES: ribosome hibernation-promoting factor, HPF/YfiA family [Aliagarivorans]|uniref:ribosome hibernation-promoting factor, HPF/YfiA family n=1 Tax=Aliagarivorans TaxID=882379 RepID=UPI0004043A14|nr:MULTISPECIES: ribosome-associated translation inhibitor RaiA [Aliagarivorans]